MGMPVPLPSALPASFRGVTALAHPHGAAQLSEDTRLTEWTLAGAAANPNVGAALLVGLDGEQGEAERVRTLAAQRSPGKRYEAIAIQDEGGSIKAIRRGCAIAKDLLRHVAGDERSAVPVGALILATQCGGSDSTSGMASNPTVGGGLGLADRAGRDVHPGGDTGVDGGRAYLGAACPQ